MIHYISSKELTIEQISDVVLGGGKLALSDEARAAIVRSREYLDAKIESAQAPIYGITTGFGSLCNVSIAKDQLSELQRNLVMSHACGMGEEVPLDIVRIILMLKIQSLSYGYSGVELTTVERLIEFFNDDIVPVVYEQGSLGASGDLAPLAHLCLPLLGLGEVYYHSKRISSEQLIQLKNWEPITLQAKEGLALLNGTQFMSGYGVWVLLGAQKLSAWADYIGAMSIDAFDGCLSPFLEPVHRVRPHRGQIDTARIIRNYLDGSSIIGQCKEHVQDPYSFRCIPQVHGAVKDTIDHVKRVITVEINSATDNPTVLPDDDMILSAGNFHGEPLALVLDFLAIAVSELGSISSQRIYQLIAGKRGLPKFLVAHPGVNSGFMIPQYAVASVVSQNKQLCTPASVDTIESSLGQEDHVSMGANAATKCLRVVDNVFKVLAVELMNSAQALDFRRPLRSGAKIEELHTSYRKAVPFVDKDRVMYHDINSSVDFLKNMKI